MTLAGGSGGERSEEMSTQTIRIDPDVFLMPGYMSALPG